MREGNQDINLRRAAGVRLKGDLSDEEKRVVLGTFGTDGIGEGKERVSLDDMNGSQLANSMADLKSSAKSGGAGFKKTMETALDGILQNFFTGADGDAADNRTRQKDMAEAMVKMSSKINNASIMTSGVPSVKMAVPGEDKDVGEGSSGVLPLKE